MTQARRLLPSGLVLGLALCVSACATPKPEPERKAWITPVRQIPISQPFCWVDASDKFSCEWSI